MYNLSKDYEKLYEYVVDGNIVACFVDYDRGTEKPLRDICSCKKRHYGEIDFSVRGISYGSFLYNEKDSYYQPYTEKIIL